MNYKMGDIVWVSEAVKVEENNNVNNHLFVIIDDDGNVVPVDYFGFVVSSNLSKSKENSIYKHNEVIQKSNQNKLKTNSIVKCDQLFNIPSSNINNKIGQVDEDDLTRFLNSFEDFMNSNNY